MAGREGFEPPEVLPSTVFKTAAFNHSAISRICEKKKYIESKIQSLFLEATPRFELGNQGFAGPCLTAWLCRLKWCPEPDLNRHERSVRGILSPLCLPFHHPGKDYFNVLKWSGRRGSNPRPQPWQGYALPLSYSRKNKLGIITMLFLKIKELIGIL